MRGRSKRISAGRFKAWEAALARGRALRRDIIMAAVLTAAFIAFLQLPYFPAYLRGFATGVLTTFFLWMLSWALWVTSGLAFRLNGVWAEDATNETLRKSSRVLATIPSLKFGMRDIDAVAITGSAVFAIETKWTSGDIAERLPGYSAQAAQDARTLRNFLAGRGLSAGLVRPVVVVCGPMSADLKPTEVSTSLGDVTVLNGHDLAAWLDALPPGPIGTDYAGSVGAHLHEVAIARDSTNIQASPVLRWLARAR